MDFDEMKLIWDQQEEQQLYAINESGLRQLLARRRQEFALLVFRQELQTYAGAAISILAIGGLLLADRLGLLAKLSRTGGAEGLGLWGTLAVLFAAGTWLVFLGNLIAGRRREARMNREEPSTLLDHIDRDLGRVDRQIAVRRHIFWHYLPVYIGAVLFVHVLFHVVNAP